MLGTVLGVEDMDNKCHSPIRYGTPVQVRDCNYPDKWRKQVHNISEASYPPLKDPFRWNSPMAARPVFKQGQ